MDSRSLDQLQQFSAFIEFLTQPEVYKKLLSDLKEASAEYNKAAEDIRGTKEFQLWRNEQLAKLESKEKEVVAAKAEIDKKYEFANAEIKAKLEGIDRTKQDLDAKANKLSELIDEQKKMLEEKAELNKEKELFIAEKVKFQMRVAEFDKKAEAFNALLKG